MIDDIKTPDRPQRSPSNESLRTVPPSDDSPNYPLDAQGIISTSLGHQTELDTKKGIKKHWFKKLGRRSKLAIICLFVVLMAGGGAGAFWFFNRGEPAGTPTSQTSKPAAKPPPPTTVASPLTGLQISPELAARPVTGIIIENSLAARPQSGLRDAGAVFEAIAEGGITRFLALFQEAQPQYVGPVRSLRPYYLDWLVPFDASIAHVGGSPQALSQVRAGLKDLDQFFNSSSYWRQNTRPAPHNVYTSFAKMDSLNKKKGYSSSKVQSWPRKPELKLATPLAKTININVSGALYKVHYDYDLPTNTYLRSEGGKPHTDTVSVTDKASQQLRPKVVVVLIMKRSIIDSRGHNGYTTNGSGSLLIFQDGGVSTGTWSKSSRDSQFVFNDPAEKALTLNAGQIWVTMAQAVSDVTYAP